MTDDCTPQRKTGDHTSQDEYPKVSSKWLNDNELVLTVRRQPYLKTKVRLYEDDLEGVVAELEEQLNGH